MHVPTPPTYNSTPSILEVDGIPWRVAMSSTTEAVGIGREHFSTASVKAWDFKLPAGSLNSQFSRGRLNLWRTAGIRLKIE